MFVPFGIIAGLIHFAIPNVTRLGIKQFTTKPEDSLLNASKPANQLVIDSTIVLGKIADNMSMTVTLTIGILSQACIPVKAIAPSPLKFGLLLSSTFFKRELLFILLVFSTPILFIIHIYFLIYKSIITTYIYI